MRRRERRQPPFSVRYVAKSGTAEPDQVLTITNNTDVSVQPKMTFVAHDVYGRELPHVTVQGVNGLHRGTPIVPAHGSLVELLRFDGPGSQDVGGVSVTLAGAEEVDHPALESPVRVVMIDLDKHAVDDPEDFWGIGIANPNPFLVTVRVSLVAFEDRVRDFPRQPADVVTLQDDVDVASGSNEVIWLPDDVRGRFHEVTHHLRPQVLV